MDRGVRAGRHPHEDPHHPHWPLAGLLFGFVLLLGLFSVHDSSTWLHIRTGAEILARRALPAADSFSYTAAGRPWTTDSWLADVIFQHLDRSGAWALIAFKSVVLAAAFALLLPINAGSPIAAAAVLGVGAAAAWPGLAETPGCFDFLLLALLIRVLRPKRALSWAAVVQVGIIELLWSNLDGSTAAIGLWLAGLKALKTVAAAGRKDRRRGLALAGAALAGLALNPRGPAAAAGLFAGTAAASWAPFSPVLNLYNVLALAGAASCWICLQSEFLLAMTAAGLLALSIVLPGLRPLYALAAGPLISVALGHFAAPWKETPVRVARLAAGLAVLFALHWRLTYAPLGRGGGYGAPRLDGALTFLRANAVGGRMFNEPGAGDELVARGARPVFVDGRAELYGPPFMKDARRWPAAFRSLAEAYRFDYAVVFNRRAGRSARLLADDPDWRLAYADDGALVYLRRSGAAGWLVGGGPRRPLDPNRLWPEELDAELSDRVRRGAALRQLDRWIVQAPESCQALLWKAYALDRMNLPLQAERLVGLASARGALGRDPELQALLAFVLERRGRAAAARPLYEQAARRARRAGGRVLEAEIDLRLARLRRQDGDGRRAAALESRAQELFAQAAALDREEAR
ncbi:MAG: hypothetical protein PHF00_02565 [Elusimicrobia bacterium]|nr:hypothetical protein [Elusimicrobiota bacterium]